MKYILILNNGDRETHTKDQIISLIDEDLLEIGEVIEVAGEA